MALLVVDVQHDYLSPADLVPAPRVLVPQIAAVLALFRAAGAPIAHIRTAVHSDGRNAMPHRRTSPQCVEGSDGALPPTELVAHPGEPVIAKQFFSGFTNPDLDAWLRRHHVSRVVIVGLYTHACVRETTLDAYSRGFDVTIVTDAVGSNEPVHASSTLNWIGSRAARLIASADVPALLAERGKPQITDENKSSSHDRAGESAFDGMLNDAHDAQQVWQSVALDARIAFLSGWAEVLHSRTDELVDAIVREVHKPVRFARDEVARAVGHIETALLPGISTLLRDENVDSNVDVVRSPLGVIGIIMPWNNPLALPVSNIAPALLAGNAVIFKPAPEAVHTAQLILQTLRDAGLDPRLVSLLFGGAEAGQRLARAAHVNAIAVTGSSSTGRALAVECARSLKPLRAELGGNNAAIVLADADLDTVVPQLALNAFAFAGQRCTALRRFVVAEAILEAFTERITREMGELRPSNPSLELCVLGPLISNAAAERVLHTIREARNGSVEVLIGGERVSVAGQDGRAHVAVTPTLLMTRDPTQPVVQCETFGPVAVIQPFRDIEHALSLANDVDQGLVLAICTEDSTVGEAIALRASAGIVQIGAAPVPIHPLAPFGGWNDSGFGGVEHGRWDIDFYSRLQAQYRPATSSAPD